MIQTILVLGATGMLGEPVARQLKASGYQVRLLSRSAEKARARFGDGYEIAAGDVEDIASLEAALDGCQAAHIFRSIVHPEKRQVFLPLWMASMFARLGRRRELQDALPFFRYCERVKIILSGSPAEANALLGAPTTTLEAWCRLQAANA